MGGGYTLITKSILTEALFSMYMHVKTVVLGSCKTYGDPMATRNELIKYLESLPEDVKISVVVNDEEGYGIQEPLDLSESYSNVEFINLTGNQFVYESDPRYNKKYLRIGMD